MDKLNHFINVNGISIIGVSIKDIRVGWGFSRAVLGGFSKSKKTKKPTHFCIGFLVIIRVEPDVMVLNLNN